MKLKEKKQQKNKNILTAAAIGATLGVNLQHGRQRVLQQVHVEVVVVLHGFLDAQLEDVGEVAGGVEAQVDHRVADAGGGCKGGGTGETSQS